MLLKLFFICSAPFAAAPSPDSAPAHERPADPRIAGLADELRDKGWIAYSAYTDNGGWDLFLCRPDGSHVRNITNTPDSREAAPRFSPDGRRLMYRRLPKDATISHDRWGFQGILMIADADGSNPRAIGGDGDLPWANWSPDGKRIACLTLKGIRIVDLATGDTVRTIPRQGMYQQLFWSPDGKWFCGVSNHFGDTWTVARMNVETGDTNKVNSFQNCTPDWFPDSNRIIFSHRPGNQDGYGWTQLWMADGDGQNRRLVYGEDGRHMYGGALSPDAKYVVLTASDKDGGASEERGAPMAVIRLADTPMITGESTALRKLHPDTKDGPVLELPAGWEPHWTDAEIGERK